MGLFSTGAVIGPGVGSFAHATSPLLAFTCLAGVGALTIPLVLRAPVGRTIAPEHSYVRSIGSVLRNRLVLAAILLSIMIRSPWARSTCSCRATCIHTAWRPGTSGRRS